MKLPRLLLVLALVVGTGAAKQLQEALDEAGAVELVGRHIVVVLNEYNVQYKVLKTTNRFVACSNPGDNVYASERNN